MTEAMQQRLINNSMLSLEYFHEGTPCWEWLGRRDPKGYGFLSVRIPGRKHPIPLRAHRVSVLAFQGVPAGEVVMHLCDRPFCIAPLHLKNGTFMSNYLDAVEKGRHINCKPIEYWPEDWEPSGI